MIKYAKVINKQTKECEVGLGTNVQFYQKLGMTEQEVEQAYNGQWYLIGYSPVKPTHDIVQEQIIALENTITARNIRSAIQGNEYALNKISQVEAQIEELRKLLPKGE